MPGLEAPPAPPPAAPAAAPAAPPTGSPRPPGSALAAARERPAPQPPGEKGSAFKNAFADLRARADMPDPEKPGLDRAKTPPATARTPEPTELGDETGEPPKGGTTNPEPAKAGTTNPQPEKKPLRASDLRAAYEQATAKATRLEKEFTEFKAQVPDPSKDPERVKLSEKLASAEKRISEYEEKLKFKDFTESAEYEEKYRTPYVEAFAEGRATVASLKLTDGEGNPRQGTAADFDNIMAIHDPDEAANAIEALFGSGVKAHMVITARAKVNGILDQARKAEAHYKKTGKEMEEGRASQVKEYQAKVAGTYNNEIKAGVEKFPQWSKPREGDAKSAEILERGQELADQAFGKPARDKDGKFIQRSPEDKAKLDAAIRNKSAWFDHVVYLWNLDRAEKKAALEKLKQYEASTPSPGDGGQREVKEPASPWDQVRADMRKRLK